MPGPYDQTADGVAADAMAAAFRGDDDVAPEAAEAQLRDRLEQLQHQTDSRVAREQEARTAAAIAELQHRDHHDLRVLRAETKQQLVNALAHRGAILATMRDETAANADAHLALERRARLWAETISSLADALGAIDVVAEAAQPWSAAPDVGVTLGRLTTLVWNATQEAGLTTQQGDEVVAKLAVLAREQGIQ